ncbi:hypothetical protein [Paracidovorax anthurii]|uniref:immunity protein TriTu family protein n=1 Tax=Paracidovorax anthurii TaxID=78229 RepID=UPI0011BEBC7A|nr:hypothetical protein [Paracidovorax anthurii]
MLKIFVDWARRVTAQSLGEGIEAQVTESAMSENRSARLDIDTRTTVARITCWESGNYHAEVIDMKSERTIFSAQGHLRDGDAIAEHFGAFLEAQHITLK